MVLYPEVQRTAQAEIDRVIGNDRLPGLDDQPNLPYIDALMKEVFRWNPVTPLGRSLSLCHPIPNVANRRNSPGLPHVSTEDDVYEGYFIPKGSTILANIW